LVPKDVGVAGQQRVCRQEPTQDPDDNLKHVHLEREKEANKQRREHTAF
jgi:hypothetical protein